MNLDGQFARLASLQDDWDGNGSPAIDPQRLAMLEITIRLVLTLAELTEPRLFLNWEGGVDAQWMRDDLGMVVEFGETYVSVLSVPLGSKSRGTTKVFNPSEVRAISTYLQEVWGK